MSYRVDMHAAATDVHKKHKAKPPLSSLWRHKLTKLSKDKQLHPWRSVVERSVAHQRDVVSSKWNTVESFQLDALNLGNVVRAWNGWVGPNQTTAAKHSNLTNEWIAISCVSRIPKSIHSSFMIFDHVFFLLLVLFFRQSKISSKDEYAKYATKRLVPIVGRQSNCYLQ